MSAIILNAVLFGLALSILATYSSRSVQAINVSASPGSTQFDCGTRASIGSALVSGGLPAKRGEVPWHAGIYQKKEYQQICGGSLVTNLIILSAAHCFWDYYESVKYPADRFAVAVGKLFRTWDDPRDSAQKSDVKEVFLPDHYLSSDANEQADLALVKVTSPFQFNSYVRPVCIEFDSTAQRTQLKPGNMGKVAGWGLTSENGDASEILRVVDLPFVDARTCISGSPSHFRGHITSDKICAGILNHGTALCFGDSGGGLAFSRKNVLGADQFFLRGIVSTAPAPKAGLCDENVYIAFTQLLHYEDFIRAHCDLGESLNVVSSHGLEDSASKALLYGRHEAGARAGVLIPKAFQAKTEWDLSGCKEEKIANGRGVEGVPLHPLSGGGPGLRLRLAVRGDGLVWIYLSREPRIDGSLGLYTKIVIRRNEAFIYLIEAGEQTRLQQTTVGAEFSSSRETRLVLSIADDTLQLLVGSSSTPLLAGRDPRFNQMKYIGFDTCCNPLNYAIFKFAC